MARAGRFRIGAMEALWMQLQFAPPAATQRMVSRIRSFISTVGPDTLHSPAAVVRELVRFPVEQVPGDADAMFVGAALRADLAELHLRLTRRVPARAGDAMELADAARACGVTVRTMRRWRDHGLLLHWVSGDRGVQRVGVRREDLDAFVRAHGERASRAAKFSQLSVRERRDIREAVAEASRAGLSERRAIAQVARAHGRAAGTVRSIVVPVMERSRAASRRSEASARHAVALWRAWCRGIPVGTAAAHLGLTDRVAQHALRAERARRLAAVRERIERDSRGLDPALVTDIEWESASSGLAVMPLPADEAGWLAMRWPAGTARPRSGTLAVVMRALLSRAASASVHAAARPARASSAALDRVETDLRWAARILLTLAIDAMPAVDARVRAWSASAEARGVLPQHAAMMAIRAVLEACTADISSLRSGRTRIERLAGAQMDLALARTPSRTPHDGRLACRALERAAPWAALAPLHDARAMRLGLAAQLEDAGTPRGMAQRRYGWGGIAPQTLEAIAHDSSRPIWVVTAAIGRALAARGRAGISAC
jgi:hypothetical protein